MMNKCSLRVSISFSFITMIIGFAVFIIFFNYSRTKENAFVLSNKITDQIVENVIEKTSSYLHKTDTHLRILTHNRSGDLRNDNEGTLGVMWECIRSEDHLTSIYLADVNGNFLQARSKPQKAYRTIERVNGKRIELIDNKDDDGNSVGIHIKPTEYDPRERPWFKFPVDENIGITPPYIFATTGKPGVTMTSARFDKMGRKLLVAAVDISLDNFTQFLKEQAKTIQGDILIYDQSNRRVVASSLLGIEEFIGIDEAPKQEVDSAQAVIQAALFTIDGQSHGTLEQKSRPYVYSGQNFNVAGGLQLGVVVAFPESVILGSLKRDLIVTVLISVAILILFIYGAFSISRMISKPIIELSDKISALRNLEPHVEISEDSRIKEIHSAQASLKSLKTGIDAFKKYMPADLVSILIRTGQEAKIGGEEKNLAIMFTDIEGFTTISEKMHPSVLTQQLSIYFGEMDQILRQHEGTIDKYIGDAIMAFWGAPIDLDQPVHKAVQCAIAMQARLDALNAQWVSEGKSPFKTRIGIHYGKTLVGNIGSERRMNYTIIGDSVNVASRLEGINKNYGTFIMLSQEAQYVVADSFETTFVDEIKLKGKTEATRIYTVGKLSG